MSGRRHLKALGCRLCLIDLIKLPRGHFEPVFHFASVQLDDLNRVVIQVQIADVLMARSPAEMFV